MKNEGLGQNFSLGTWRKLGCPMCNWEDDIKYDLEVIWCEVMDWV
jgi:hypothetical protein